MARIILFGVTIIASFALGHMATLYMTPEIIMKKTMEKMIDRGVNLHAFALSPRATPDTQSVVRPSPDLAYSICLFDFEKISGPIKIIAAPWDNYASISFFDARTNNFATVSNNSTMSEIYLLPPERQGSEDENAEKSGDRIIAPTKRGIILLRRLAPTDDAYRVVKAITSGDQCTPV